MVYTGILILGIEYPLITHTLLLQVLMFVCNKNINNWQLPADQYQFRPQHYITLKNMNIIKQK